LPPASINCSAVDADVEGETLGVVVLEGEDDGVGLVVGDGELERAMEREKVGTELTDTAEVDDCDAADVTGTDTDAVAVPDAAALPDTVADADEPADAVLDADGVGLGVAVGVDLLLAKKIPLLQCRLRHQGE